MSDHILVISQENCGACTTVKDYFAWKKMHYEEKVIDKDITTEEFWKEYKDEADHGTPLVYVNGKFVYDVIAYYESGLG